MIEQTDSLSLFTDGERRYGNLLFEICTRSPFLHRIGKTRTSPKTAAEKVRVRLKNKGLQKATGSSTSKVSQAPVPEHPKTTHDVAHKDIHANHLEAFNASGRRRNSTFRRKTNTAQANRKELQRTLDVFGWCIQFLFEFISPLVKLSLL